VLCSSGLAVWILRTSNTSPLLTQKLFRNSRGLSDPKDSIHKISRKKYSYKVDQDNIVLANQYIIKTLASTELPWEENKSIEEFHRNKCSFFFQEGR
jgi:hypothetical protein